MKKNTGRRCVSIEAKSDCVEIQRQKVGAGRTVLGPWNNEYTCRRFNFSRIEKVKKKE